mmetsp:Transcript_15877/g.19689  ORF Transcript_15877/g.19689 Transcript_15877/m.19689 type:complete len:112 (-) Transcript_15877:177-512(-)
MHPICLIFLPSSSLLQVHRSRRVSQNRSFQLDFCAKAVLITSPSLLAIFLLLSDNVVSSRVTCFSLGENSNSDHEALTIVLENEDKPFAKRKFKALDETYSQIRLLCTEIQ